MMLNAASANGPREIQIGLPSADVNVLENGIPVTYATNPHSVNSLWRADARSLRSIHRELGAGLSHRHGVWTDSAEQYQQAYVLLWWGD